jgi:hypothetical protein
MKKQPTQKQEKIVYTKRLTAPLSSRENFLLRRKTMAAAYTRFMLELNPY